MKTITVLSGKGGVGKSSITASLAVLLAKNHKIIAADCDVDAPNLALVLGVEDKDLELLERVKTSERAVLLKENCNACKDCLQACNYAAIKWDDVENLPKISNFLCVGCGACTLVCLENAIRLETFENASITAGDTEYGFPIVSGQLDIGASGSGKVVNAVKIWASEIAGTINAEFMIVDSAAGIGCPVIASVRGSDYVILVSEPTPAAFSDLKRAIEVVEHFKIPRGGLINKCDINNKFSEEIEEYFSTNSITVIGKVPYDKKFVYALVNLKPVILSDDEIADIFRRILKKALKNLESS